MKNVLLLVHDDVGQEARLQAALDLTRALGGHLSCIDVSIYPMFVGDYYNAGMAEASLLRDECQAESENKVRTQARLMHEDVAWDWTDVTGNPADALVDAAILADVIVLNRRLDEDGFPDMHDIASRVLMHARTPVLAVPDDFRRLDLRRALVAWDGQRSCAATLRASVPLLALAEAVEIFMVNDNSSRLEPIRAAQYLSRHGVHASVHVTDDGFVPADRLIAKECGAFGADFVVMGAYSRGRLMEAFGGVTKRMLNDAPVPLVLGH